MNSDGWIWERKTPFIGSPFWMVYKEYYFSLMTSNQPIAHVRYFTLFYVLSYKNYSHRKFY